MNDVLTPKEVRDYLRISENTLDRWVKNKRLRVIQTDPRGARRFLRSDVDGLLKEENE